MAQKRRFKARFDCSVSNRTAEMPLEPKQHYSMKINNLHAKIGSKPPSANAETRLSC
jgi:hypothetical protein